MTAKAQKGDEMKAKARKGKEEKNLQPPNLKSNSSTNRLLTDVLIDLLDEQRINLL